MFVNTLILRTFHIEYFINIKEDVLPEVVRLFYANMSTNGDDPIIRSFILGKPAEFNLELLCEILKLQNEGGIAVFLPTVICPGLVDPRKKSTPSSPT